MDRSKRVIIIPTIFFNALSSSPFFDSDSRGPIMQSMEESGEQRKEKEPTEIRKRKSHACGLARWSRYRVTRHVRHLG
jgi:hypothetical protein